MREETRKLVMDLIIQGIHRNADRIFDLSQNTKKGYVPVVTGTLKKSGTIDKTPVGAIIGYQADYACVGNAENHYVMLADRSERQLTLLHPGDSIMSDHKSNTVIIAIARYKFDPYKLLFRFITETGKAFDVTHNHYIPIQTCGKWDFVQAIDIQPDSFLRNSVGDEEKIVNIIQINPCPYVWDIQTESGTFVLNGIVVHNSDVEFGRDARPIESGEQIVHRKAHKREGYVTKKGIVVHATRVKASEVKYVGKRLIAIRPKTKGSKEPTKNRKPIFRVISSYAATRPQLFLTRAVRDGLPFIGKDIKFFLDRI